MVGEVGLEEEAVLAKEAPQKEIPKKAQPVLDEFGVEVDCAESATKLAMKNAWTWEKRGTFIACCRVVERTVKLGLEPREQIWVKIALGGKGPERVKKEGTKLSGLKKIIGAGVNKDVSVNFPTLWFAGLSEKTHLPLIAREFAIGNPILDDITNPDIVGPIAKEWHQWQRLVCSEEVLEVLSDEEGALLIEEKSFEDQIEIFQHRLGEYKKSVIEGRSELAKKIEQIVSYSPSELEKIFKRNADWYQAHADELKFRVDDSVVRNWVIFTELRKGEACIVDHGSSRFGPEAMAMHDVAYALMNVWRKDQGAVRERILESFIEKAPDEKKEDYKKGVCFNILLRSIGSLAHEADRAVDKLEKGKNAEKNIERAVALAKMINLVALGYTALKEGIVELHP